MGNLCKKLIAWLITFPIFLLLLGFAFLNRHGVTLNLNPLEFGLVPAEVFLPLSVIMLLCVAIGAVIGGVIVRFSIRANRQAIKKITTPPHPGA